MRRFRVRKAARLDQIARDIYGSEAGGTTEAILSANAALAGIVGDVPEGTEISVPDEAHADAPVVRPWI